MKRLLLAGLAAAMLVPAGGVRAADMAVKAPPPPAVAPQFNWSGIYVGGNVGGGWVTAPLVDDLTGFNVGTPGNGSVIGGGQVGFNYQFSPFLVFGAEWFWDAIGQNSNQNNVTFLGLNGDTLNASAQANWIMTATGRVGVTGPLWDHWLLYAKGGWGWLNTQAALTDLTTGASISSTTTREGWVFGVGIEWAFAQNWTAKLEWQYLGLEDFTVGPGIIVDPITARNADVNTLTFGINYLFNYWGGPAAPPVVSRY
jgi:outer membrane immunogenic protein